MLTPTLVDAFQRLRGVLGTPREADVLAEVYATLPAVNFSQAILARSAPRLAVLPMEGVYWSDWGDPRRLLLDLAHFGNQRSQEPSSQAIPMGTTMIAGGQCGRADRASTVG